MKRARAQRMADGSGALALAGLALTSWSVVDPSPLAVILAMTAGQVLGTASLALLVTAIIIDLRQARVLSNERGPTSPPPP